MSHTLSSIPRLAEGLRQGMTLLYPTDTIWGLGCSALSHSALQRLYTIKQRDPKKSMLLLLPDTTPLLADPLLAPLLLAQRPTTVILPAHRLGCDGLVGLADDGTVGVRIPRHDFCQALIKQLGAPLISTSANLSGEPSPTGFHAVNEAIKRQVDLIASPQFDTASAHLHTQQGRPAAAPAPSRILKLQEDGSLLTIRD